MSIGSVASGSGYSEGSSEYTVIACGDGGNCSSYVNSKSLGSDSEVISSGSGLSESGGDAGYSSVGAVDCSSEGA